MLSHSLVFLLLVAATALVLLATLRATRSPRPALRWGGTLGGGLAALVLLLVTCLSARGMWMMYAPRGRAIRDLRIEATPQRIARGQHIANTYCVNCHTLNGELPLSGGKNISDEAGMPLGDLYTINLTPAGPLATWTDGEIFRAVREAADQKGHRLPVMSAQRARNLSDEDLMSLIAYLRSQPAVKNETPPPRPSYLAIVLAGAGMLPLLPGSAPDTIVAPSPAPTLAYGKYMVTWMGCDECHGANYEGGTSRIVPNGPNLRSVKNWSAAQFIETFRTGKTPFGKQLDPAKMPWKTFGRMTDDELTAIHSYLLTLN